MLANNNELAKSGQAIRTYSSASRTASVLLTPLDWRRTLTNAAPAVGSATYRAEFATALIAKEGGAQMQYARVLRKPQHRTRIRAADDFAFIGRRLAQLEAKKYGSETTQTSKADPDGFDVICQQPTPQANLGELIENGDRWWSEEVITDGADHFVLRFRDGGRS